MARGWTSLAADAFSIATLMAFAVLVALIVTDGIELAQLQTPSTEARFYRVIHDVDTVTDPLTPAPDDDRVLWLLGGSSLVLPERAVLVDELESRAAAKNCPLTVRNLARNGGTLVQAQAALAEAAQAFPTPDAILVYAGHNAYRKAYLGERTALGFPLQYTLSLQFGASVALGNTVRCRDCTWHEAWRWHRAQRVGPWMHRLQALGILRLDPAFWQRIDAMTAEAFAERLGTIRRQAHELEADLLVEVPIGNLDPPIYGLLPEIQRLERRIAEAPDPRSRDELRLELRDVELFTADLRAKRRVRDHIRSLAAAPDVAVFDLERAFLDSGTPMDSSTFSDHVHFTRLGHQRHVDHLLPWLLDQLDCPE